MRCTVKRRLGLSCAGRFCRESAIRYGVGTVSAIFSNQRFSNEERIKGRRKLVKYISIAIFYTNVIFMIAKGYFKYTRTIKYQQAKGTC